MFTLGIADHSYSARWAGFYPALVAKGPYLGRVGGRTAEEGAAPV